MSQARLDVAELRPIAGLRSRFEPAWRRLDNVMLRLEGRIDTPSYDRWLPWGFAVLHAAILIVFALARYNSLDLGAETAKYAQATWQITQGWRPVTTLAGGNIIAEQGSLVLYPLAGLTAVLPRTETLLVIKSLALAITIVPLWRLARTHGRLGIGVASAVVFAYTVYTSVHAMNATDFAPAVLAVPALMFATLMGLGGRDRLAVAAMIFALCCRADLGIAIAGLGVLLLLERRKNLGRAAILIGLGWFLASIYGLQPWLNDGSHDFLAPYYSFGETPLRALWGIVTHPVRFLTMVGSMENFLVVVSLLAPVLFLPLTAPRYLLPAVPLYVLYMGADVEAGRLSEAAQTVPVTVFVFVALVFAMQRSGRILVKRVRVERRIVLALLLTATVFFVRDSPTSPYREPWEWGTRDVVDAERLDAIDRLPSAAVAVRASSSMLPLLSERLGIYPVTTDPESDLDSNIEAMVDRVDWLLLDPADEQLQPVDLDRFRSRVLELGFHPIARSDEGGIEVFKFTGVVASALVEEAQSADGDGS